MRILAVLLSSIALGGCFHVKNQLYNPESAVTRVVHGQPQQVEHRSVVKVFTDHDTVDPDCIPAANACLAFLEFDEMGEMWDPGQLDKAIELIKRAKKLSPHPIVVTFTHGWKNNAKDTPGHANENVFGFEGVLDFLEHPPVARRFADSPVVGIYIGWRGNLVSQYWPVRQQFSYFNREGAAIRIPGASLTAALTRIMQETHRDPAGARAIMVGHSFGGLVMERALSQAMADYILRGGGQNGDDGAWADLVVFVNSAAAASEGKQMLDLFKRLETTRNYKFVVTPAAAALEKSQTPALARTAQRPMFLSISSLGDIATRFGLVIGHGPSALSRQFTGSWRTYEHPDIPSVPSQRSYYLSTTAHMEVLQSHLIVENTQQTLKQCGQLFSPTPVKISTGQQYIICEKPNRWNDTPYWAMEMPATIVPDHSGIFNLNFIALLEKFLPSQAEMENPDLMPKPQATPLP